jgi:hypothetical protein
MTIIASIAFLVLGLQAQPAPSQSALRIVVVQGEDAVNIIQQKTAVAPIVEIRDRNNLPVAGATVTFTIGGQGASFGGLSTLTVTTNAAGQAAAVGFTPTAAGAIQINASALVQGQALTATITQTNVLTAAQAVGAAGATGGAGGGAGGGGAATSGAAAGGGGISGTTIGIVGAAAAVGGGALIATQVVGGSDEYEFVGTFQGQLSWNFATCVRIHEMSAKVTIYLETLEGAITGDAKIEGTSRVIGFAGTPCGAGPQIGSSENLGITNTTPVTGSPSSLTFAKQESNFVPASGNTPGGTHTVSFSFTGTLSGDTITGTIVHSEKSETPGNPAGVGTASYPITLRKQ